MAETHTASTVPAVPVPEAPVAIADTHKNIEFGNSYRLELSKTMLFLAAGLFAFTISFPPQLRVVEHVFWMQLGWAGLAISMLGGFVNLYGWEKFYLTFRDYDHKEQVRGAGKAARNRITLWRRIGRAYQFLGFAMGVFGVGMFAQINFPNIGLAH